MGRFRISAFAALMVSVVFALPELHGCGDDGDGAKPAGGAGGQKDAAGGTSTGGSPDARAGSGGSSGDSSLDSGAAGSAPDSASGGTAGTTDAADPNKIIATSRDIFFTDAGEDPRDFDLSTLDIAAYVLEGDGGAPTFRIHAPTFPRLGTAEINGVPPGPYYLRFNRLSDPPFFVLTSTRSVDISSVNHGRPDSRRAAVGTTLVLNASGLNPWQASDDISLYSYNVAALLFSLNAVASSGQPAVNDTTLNGLTVDYEGRAEVARLIEGTKGDRATIIQLVTRALGASDAYLAAGKVFELPVFSMNDGLPTTVSGAFTDLPQSSSISVDWKLPEYVNLGAANPGFTRELSLFRVSVTRAPQHGPFGIQPELLNYSNTGTTSVAASFNYGNPFASGYTVIADILQYFSKPYAVSGASPTPFFVRVSSAVQAASSVTMSPLVGPVANLRLNGQDALSNLNGVGRNPTVSWTAPAVGSANGYLIRFFRLFNDAGTTRRAIAGFVSTTGTSFVTPPGIMTTGNIYVIEVNAQHMPSVDRDARPLRVGYPFGEATVLSGMFTP